MLGNLVYEAAIGQGAFAYVSRYADSEGNKFAVKKLKKESRENESEVKRFKREIELLRALENEPNIVQLVDFNDEELWYIMPLAEQNLHKYISKNNQHIDIEERIKIFEHIIDGISVAHSKSILHRDITPNNVLKIKDGWYVCDFGLGKDYTKLTQGGYSSVQGYGSYNYAAPEQVDKLKDASIQSDIYSLGKVLYFILTGREPRDISDVDDYKFIIKGAASEKTEDRYESVSVLKKELIKHKELYAKIRTTSTEHITVREYLNKEDVFDLDEFYEVMMRKNIYDHVYYDFIQPIVNYFDKNNKIINFISAIGQEKTTEFLKVFIENLHDCYTQVGWPFSSLNSFGYFFNRFYNSVPENTSCQLECLQEIWKLATSFDQWAMQDLIIDMISTNKISDSISEDFAFFIVELDKDFVKLDRLNLRDIQSEVLTRAIKLIRA